MLGQLKSSWERIRSSLSNLYSRAAFKVGRSGASIGLVSALIIFSILSTPFRRLDNFMLIALVASLVGIVAVGQTLVLLIGGIDLSVGSVVALTGVVAAGLMKGVDPLPPLPSFLAIGVSLIFGTAVGGLQGWLITNRNMPPFIVTLGTMIGLSGLAQAYTNTAGAAMYTLPDDFKWIADGQIGPLPAPALIMLGIYILIWYLLQHSKFGRYCYAIGKNETSARLAGINVNLYKIYIYAISGLLASVVGMILIARINGGIYTNGAGYELSSIAAAIIGGTSLSGGVGGVWGTLIGVLLLNTVNNGLTLCSVPPEWQQVVTGLIILLAVGIDVERRRKPKTLTKVEVPLITPTQLHLHQIILRLSKLVEEQMGYLYCCLYLQERETAELIPRPPFKTGTTDSLDSNSADLPQTMNHYSNLVREVKENGRALWVGEVNKTFIETNRISLLYPSVQSVLAIPLHVGERFVGVFEVQSIVPDCFNITTSTMLHKLCNPLTAIIEDAWLLESGWIGKQVRDNLRHLWDDLYLGRSQLTDWLLSTADTETSHTMGARGEALREVLLKGIETLHPVESRDQTRASRGYRILQLTYLEEHGVESIIKELNISRRQYFYDLKETLDILADTIVREHQVKLQATSLKLLYK
jgi:ribose/xylose/arabinose/galactoside ABC-type transport system permease subunit